MHRQFAAGKRPRAVLAAVLALAFMTGGILMSTGNVLAASVTTEDGYTIERTRSYSSTTVSLEKYEGTDTELTLPATGTFNGTAYPIEEINSFLSDALKRNVTSVTIPEGYTTINASAFKGCTALQTVHIPSTVTSIGSNAFEGCTSLKTLDIAGGNKKLRMNNAAFTGCTSLESVVLPKRIRADEDGTNYFYGCTALKKVNVTDSEDYITSEEGALFLKQKDEDGNVTGLTLVVWPEAKLDTALTLPERVDTIPLTAIGAHAFRNNQTLEKVTVPKQVNTFKRYCFNGCMKLKSLTLLAEKADAVTYETVDSNAFTDLPGGSTIYTVSGEMKTKIQRLAQDEADHDKELYGYGTLTPRYTEENTSIAVIKAAEPGDLNEDGKLDLLDLTEAQKYYKVKRGDSGWEQAAASDMNRDGKIDLEDLTALYQMIYK